MKGNGGGLFILKLFLPFVPLCDMVFPFLFRLREACRCELLQLLEELLLAFLEKCCVVRVYCALDEFLELKREK